MNVTMRGCPRNGQVVAYMGRQILEPWTPPIYYDPDYDPSEVLPIHTIRYNLSEHVSGGWFYVLDATTAPDDASWLMACVKAAA